MVHQRPSTLSGNPVEKAPPPPSGSGKTLWVVAAIALVAVIAVNQRPSTTSGALVDNEAMKAGMGNAQQALVSAVAAQAPPPKQALSDVAVKRGMSRVATTGREGAAGRMVYSQNCYDALGRSFSWHKLDECGGFDAEATLATTDDTAAAATESAWFEAETSAGRYLKAATAAGLEATDADQRLARLQTLVARKHPGPSDTAPATQPADGDASETPPMSLPLGNAG